MLFGKRTFSGKYKDSLVVILFGLGFFLFPFTVDALEVVDPVSELAEGHVKIEGNRLFDLRIKHLEALKGALDIKREWISSSARKNVIKTSGEENPEAEASATVGMHNIFDQANTDIDKLIEAIQTEETGKPTRVIFSNSESDKIIKKMLILYHISKLEEWTSEGYRTFVP